MNAPAYLGDGVYAHVDEWNRIVLTTGHHDPKQADNVIVLEPEVAREFEGWRERAEAATK